MTCCAGDDPNLQILRPSVHGDSPEICINLSAQLKTPALQHVPPAGITIPSRTGAGFRSIWVAYKRPCTEECHAMVPYAGRFLGRCACRIDMR